MAVKIELEKKEISMIYAGLKCYARERGEIVKTGKYMGHKVNKAGIDAARNEKKQLENLANFFEGL